MPASGELHRGGGGFVDGVVGGAFVDDGEVGDFLLVVQEEADASRVFVGVAVMEGGGVASMIGSITSFSLVVPIRALRFR